MHRLFERLAPFFFEFNTSTFSGKRYLSKFTLGGKHRIISEGLTKPSFKLDIVFRTLLLPIVAITTDTLKFFKI